MTVGVGAICENGQVAVVAADRMVTFGVPMNLQTEPPIKKIVKIIDGVAIVFSGSVPDGETIVSNTKDKAAGSKKPAVGYCPKTDNR